MKNYRKNVLKANCIENICDQIEHTIEWVKSDLDQEKESLQHNLEDYPDEEFLGLKQSIEEDEFKIEFYKKVVDLLCNIP